MKRTVNPSPKSGCLPPDYYESGMRKNLVQRYWHEKSFEVIEKLVGKANGLLIDIGCDGGWLLNRVRDSSGASVIGLDIDEGSLYHANEVYSLPVLVADGSYLPFKNESCDLITCFEVLEHVHHPDRIIKESYRCLRKGGYFIVMSPNNNLLWRLIWFFWTRTFGKTWEEKHVYDFDERVLRALLENNGLRIVDIMKSHLGMEIAAKAVKE